MACMSTHDQITTSPIKMDGWMTVVLYRTASFEYVYDELSSMRPVVMLSDRLICSLHDSKSLLLMGRVVQHLGQEVVIVIEDHCVAHQT